MVSPPNSCDTGESLSFGGMKMSRTSCRKRMLLSLQLICSWLGLHRGIPGLSPLPQWAFYTCSNKAFHTQYESFSRECWERLAIVFPLAQGSEQPHCVGESCLSCYRVLVSKESSQLSADRTSRLCEWFLKLQSTQSSYLNRSSKCKISLWIANVKSTCWWLL